MNNRSMYQIPLSYSKKGRTMPRIIIILTILLPLTILLFHPAIADDVSILKPGKPVATKFRIHSMADKDGIPVEGLFNNEKERRFTMIQPEDECERIITNRTHDDYEFNWGYLTPGDSGAVYFQAPTDLMVVAVRLRPYNWQGNLLIDFWETPYSGNVIDEDLLAYPYEEQWLSGGTSPIVDFSSPLGLHVAGPVSKTISEADSVVWTQINIPQKPTFAKGDHFCVGMWFQITGGWGFTAESERGLTADLFKWYSPPSTGPDGTHSGWFIRRYHHQLELLVTYLGDSPPDIIESYSHLTPFHNDQTCIIITDTNCGGGPSGVDQAWFHYMTFGATTFDSIVMTGIDSEWCIGLPCRPLIWELWWYFSAVDIMGNRSNTVKRGFFCPCGWPSFLTIYNASDSLQGSIHESYLEGALNVCGYPFYYGDYALWTDLSM